MLAVVFIAAMAAVATAADAPVSSADLVTPGDQYPMPQGLDSWASVLADVFMQKVCLATVFGQEVMRATCHASTRKPVLSQQCCRADVHSARTAQSSSILSVFWQHTVFLRHATC